MRLKILKNLIGKGGVKGIILNLLVSAAIGYITKKFAGNLSQNPSKNELIDALRGSSSDWDDILGKMSNDDLERFIRHVLKNLK